MIKVLQHCQEVEAATQQLQKASLPTHITTEKNWDQWWLYQLLHDQDRQSSIIDLGCGDCCTLDFLAALEFEHLHGIDLAMKPSLQDRPYQLYEGDLTATPFADESYDVAVSISVIEHGVDLNTFFREASRLLKPGGLLFVTTDYWQTKIAVESSIQPFGLPWIVFSQPEIEHAIACASSYGLVLDRQVEIPACAESTVSWYEKHYTFIALVFRKSTEL
ncbi:MAG: methyltransferase domain-containing protein [Myxacorys californica WJT36-NPBG1]|nr:methyltransferase domain-containing protein [Myxacorys californica WJT36-NPBG1]